MWHISEFHDIASKIESLQTILIEMPRQVHCALQCGDCGARCGGGVDDEYIMTVECLFSWLFQLN